ncbi:MarP family serine protease [Nocardia terpenica]|uniref:MarP family serine protease n=1 Tax=Nocardia terpenica TaxID=455432 RepID=A0A6G9YZQ6_9NOCA|nr:MarP family serine protease [Nocardia terpenica]
MWGVSLTLANWFDLVVLLAMVVAGVLGWRRGAIVAALGFLGVVGGAFVGTVLAAVLLPHLPAGTVRLTTVVAVIVGVVAVGQAIGDRLGQRLRETVHGQRALRVDAVAGGFGQALAVPLTVWLLAAPLAAPAQSILASTLDHSRVVRTVGDTVPYWLASLPTNLAGPLRDSGLMSADGWSMPGLSTAPPDTALLGSPVPREIQRSVLRVRSIASGCGLVETGSGFVFAPERVLTNAHVVAGGTSVSVDTPNGPLKADVVAFDSSNDLAVLHVAGLTAPALTPAPRALDTGAAAFALGYPGGGRYAAAAARIRSRTVGQVPDAYRAAMSDRQLYTISSLIQEGNSGGPLIDTEGRVLGIVFGSDPDDERIGYAMNLQQVFDRLGTAVQSNQPVPNGHCRR